MKTSSALAGLLCLSLTVACADRDDGREARHGLPPSSETAQGAGAEAVTVTGCLTSADGKFVLTELEPADGAQPRATTETYQLENLEDQLRPHVGRQIRVYGQADPAQVAEVREVAPATGGTGAAGATGTTGTQVDTQTTARVEMRRLRITTVTPTGAACAA